MPANPSNPLERKPLSSYPEEWHINAREVLGGCGNKPCVQSYADASDYHKKLKEAHAEIKKANHAYEGAEKENVLNKAKIHGLEEENAKLKAAQRQQKAEHEKENEENKEKIHGLESENANLKAAQRQQKDQYEKRLEQKQLEIDAKQLENDALRMENQELKTCLEKKTRVEDKAVRRVSIGAQQQIQIHLNSIPEIELIGKNTESELNVTAAKSTPSPVPAAAAGVKRNRDGLPINSRNTQLLASDHSSSKAPIQKSLKGTKPALRNLLQFKPKTIFRPPPANKRVKWLTNPKLSNLPNDIILQPCSRESDVVVAKQIVANGSLFAPERIGIGIIMNGEASENGEETAVEAATGIGAIDGPQPRTPAEVDAFHDSGFDMEVDALADESSNCSRAEDACIMNNLNHLLPSFIPFLAEALATYGLSSTDLVINTFLQATPVELPGMEENQTRMVASQWLKQKALELIAQAQSAQAPNHNE